MSVTFHPVGQGLFASGLVDPGARHFTWVFDCGTTSRDAILERALNEYNARSPGMLDLLAISHFDSDHTSGIARLVRGRFIKTVLLPYVPLAQRVLRVFSGGSGSRQDANALSIRPIATIRALADVGRIIVVPPSGGESRVPETGPPDGGSDDDIIADAMGADDAEELVSDMSDVASATSAVVLRPGGALRCPGLSEFVPYNDASLWTLVDKQFHYEVRSRRDALLAGGSHSEIALRELRSIYDARFGRTGKRRNLISLFLYAGPLRASAHRKAGLLFTGDGYLHTPERYRALATYLGPARIGNIACLQVMHHGAKTNWYSGLAKEISADIAVFSSDPTNAKLQHPNTGVVADFASGCLLQADQTHECKLEACVCGYRGYHECVVLPHGSTTASMHRAARRPCPCVICH